MTPKGRLSSEVSATGRYEVAAIYSLGVGQAGSDERLPPVGRAALAERTTFQAAALPKKLREQGYFKDAAHLEYLRADEELNALCVRRDFQKLLTQGASQ